MRLGMQALFVAWVCFGCAAAAVRKGDQPQDFYEEGMDNFRKELWTEASQAFVNLKTKYPYSKYAALAELRQADIKFKNDRFLEAIDAYRLFVQYHPTHEEVQYAIYREAISHYKEITDDFFFLPPSYEKDQIEVDRAARLLREYLERFPSGKDRKDAEVKLRECNARLAQHDLYVARFYYAREKWHGAARRYEIARTYVSGSALEPVVLLELGQSYVKLKEMEKSRGVFAQLIERHPNSAEAKAAAQQLRR